MRRRFLTVFFVMMAAMLVLLTIPTSRSFADQNKYLLQNSEASQITNDLRKQTAESQSVLETESAFQNQPATETQTETETQSASETEQQVVLNGLVKMDGKIYYYKDNVPVKSQLKKINGKKYYFTKTGAALINSWKTIDGDKYYFGKNGVACQKSHKIGDNYYVFRLSGKLCKGKGKRLVQVDGCRYYVNKNGRAISGWQPVNGNMIYAYKSGKLATNKKVSYIKLGSKGYATNKWQAFAKYYARKFINKHTKSGWSKKKKLRVCFWYLKKHMHYVAHYVPDSVAKRTNGWQYKAAVHMLSTKRLSGNCRCWASSFAAIAKELGYKPTVCSMYWHSIVRIDGKYYDYIHGGKFRVGRQWYFTSFYKTFRF